MNPDKWIDVSQAGTLPRLVSDDEPATSERILKEAVREHPPALSAPGVPGIAARWTSSAKTGVGTALSNDSMLWFTVSHGIVNEVYCPRIDRACIRDVGLIVTDGAHFFSEEKRDAESKTEWIAEGVPAFRLINTCRNGRYRIEKHVIADPKRNTLLQRVAFFAQRGAISDYRLYVLLAPHLGNQGADNSAWVGDFEGTPVLFATRADQSLALVCSARLLKRSAGYVGSSDGWQDLKANKRMTWEYLRAEHGNVALTAQIELDEAGADFVLALGFGAHPEQAARNAISSLRDGFQAKLSEYIAGWQSWTKTHAMLDTRVPNSADLSRVSLAVLRTHESKTAPGGLIASLAIPWGSSKGDKDLGGYHLVWSRDMVQAAGGLLAAGAHEDARRVLDFLRATQRTDGHWPQNTWVDGKAYWNGIQMDETALPVLLVDLALRERALQASDIGALWPMVRKAAGYLVRNGPVSAQDRWEEDPGYSPFTVGAEIAALLVAAEMAELNQEPELAGYLRETADVWYASIDHWMYVSETDWSRRFDVNGYYVRIAPVATGAGARLPQREVDVKNVADAEDSRPAAHLVSPDAFALVRFGLRAANDRRMRDTATVIDAALQIETPSGPAWHRYNDDGYGEHADGRPFDGTGIGRGWPLLTGERAHFELSAGRMDAAKQLTKAMELFANEGGLISEQVWDSPDIPEYGLRFGRPSGSAMPLVWAHAEYLKLQRSLREGRVFDLPPQTVQRYLMEKTSCSRRNWRFNHKLRVLPPRMLLRIETLAPALVHWSADGWKTTHDVETRDAGLGIHFIDLGTAGLADGARIKFTFYWPDAKHWEGSDFSVVVSEP
ncbi:MAG TPA: glucan 1,4-alpha-glucosidase [Polyangiaceae bacterium]|jgi:glucoamylase|nr:glucan 1,4-alpha-glucosidase [Polyangiaceae bacterium]